MHLCTYLLQLLTQSLLLTNTRLSFIYQHGVTARLVKRFVLTQNKPNNLHRSVWAVARPLKIENFATPLQTKFVGVTNTDSLRLFFLYLAFANGSSDTSYVIHAHWKPFFIRSFGSNLAPYIDPMKLIQRWNHTYHLLYNLFYNQSQMVAFSNKTLKTESSAFNWTAPVVRGTLFRYATPFFWLKNNSYGSDILVMYSKLSDRGLEASFVTDTRYHQQTVFFLRKCGIYTLGLVAYTANPWLLHYPVPVASSTLFTQYFFLKYIIYVKRSALYQCFRQLKQSWNCTQF
jgi:hypothetical protein